MTITKNGKKMYPVGAWQKIQHIFYNYDDRCANELDDVGYTEEAFQRKEDAERFLDICRCNEHDGMVYAEYEDYKKMKDIIGGYIWRHS